MSLYKIILLFLIITFLFSGCITEENKDQSFLKSYRTLTPVTVTEERIDQIINDLNYSEFNDDQIQDKTVFPVKVYRITYRTKYKGEEIFASGAVTIPETDGSLPILNYYHGTIFKDNRVPSKYNGTDDMEVETALNIIFASTGFVCVAPDLIGYGDSTDKLHPYHLYYPTARASVDMLYAVKELCAKLDINLSGKYFITGFSEGAFSAMAVQRDIQEKYKDEFTVFASSLGAGAYHLSETVKRMLDGKNLVSPAYIAFLISSYNEYYGWGRDLSEIFRSPYSTRIKDGLLWGDLTQSEINNQLTFKTTSLFTSPFLSDFRGSGEEQLKDAFVENDLYGDWKPEVSTRLYHGTLDNVVPVFNSETAYNSFIQKGGDSIDYIPLYKKDHETAIIPWIKATILWFNSF